MYLHIAEWQLPVFVSVYPTSMIAKLLPAFAWLLVVTVMPSSPAAQVNSEYVVIRFVQGRDSGGCAGNRAAVSREACQVGGRCCTGDDSLTDSDVAVNA